MTSSTRSALLALAIVAGAVIVIRAPSLRVEILNEDEALYATTAASMATGEPPYRAGVESKPPGIFYLYEGGFAVVGRYNMIGLHALTILWVLGTALVVGGLARRAAPRPPDRDPPRRWSTPVIASLLYAAFTIVQEPAVLATQCELLYSLPLALAAWLVVGRGQGAVRRVGPALVAAGVLCAAATLIKPTAISLPVAATAWLVLRRPLLGARTSLPGDLARVAALWLGFALAWGAAALYFMHLGVWDDLVYWAFRWTLGLYIPTGASHSPWLRRFLAGFVVWFVLVVILWLLAAVAAGSLKRRGEPAAAAEPVQVTWFLLAWTLAATALTFLGGRFFDHYFPAVIPPLAALAAVGFERIRGSARWRRAVAVATIVPTLACWLGAWQFSTTMRWLGDERRPYDQIAAYVHDHTRDDERVFVWGYYPLIYVAADRLAASRFVGCHYVTGYAAIGLAQDLPPELEDRLGVPDAIPTLLRDLEHHRPALVIDTQPADLHHWRRYPLSRYPELANYVATHYRAETTVQNAVIYRRLP
jgi:hypothetical protein